MWIGWNVDANLVRRIIATVAADVAGFVCGAVGSSSPVGLSSEDGPASDPVTELGEFVRSEDEGLPADV
jgi:hypothetical protein